MKPIFCGNFEYDARQSEVERLFRRYGRVDRVDMKSGFAFVYMEDERDGEDAIRGLDQIEFGRKGRRLRVEWTKHERGVRRTGSGGGSRKSANTRPSKTLFVINFDPYQTRTRDLERHFDVYGRIVNVRIRRNFAFIQFESQHDATKALEATHLSKLMDRLISVEYAIRDDDERRDGYSPDRTRDRSPVRRGYDRARSRSISPYRRERGSPDYGRGPSQSPRRKERASPDYGRRSSPSPYRRERANSVSSHDVSPPRSLSPRKRRGLSSSPHGRDHPEYSPSPRRGDNDGHAVGSSPRACVDNNDRSPQRDAGHTISQSASPYERDDHAPNPRTSPGQDGACLSSSPVGDGGIEAIEASPGACLSSSPVGDGGIEAIEASPGAFRDDGSDPIAEMKNSPTYREESPTAE